MQQNLTFSFLENIFKNVSYVWFNYLMEHVWQAIRKTYTKTSNGTMYFFKKPSSRIQNLVLFTTQVSM